MKYFSVILSFVLVACNMSQLEKDTLIDSDDDSTTYDCTYYSQYNSYTDCQTASLANCNAEWQSFPTGGAALCYFPYDGWETCSQTVTDWIYTPWQVQCYDTVALNFVASRSVVTCSSSICACLNPQQLETTCTAMTCPAPTPSPMPNCPI